MCKLGVHMNFFKTLPFFSLAILLFCGNASAAPAYPGLIESTQPDGSVVQIRKVGNERFHYTVSEDSVLIVRDSLGFWNYADEEGASTGVRFHRHGERGELEQKFLKERNSKKILDEFVKEKKRKRHEKEPERKVRGVQSSAVGSESVRRSFRAASATPLDSVLKKAKRPYFDPALTQGEIRGLVILVEFSDVKFKSSDPQAEFNRYMNEEGYNENGMRWSPRDYFVSNSMGAFRPYFDVAAPVTLTKVRSYYGGQEYPDEAFFEAINEIQKRGDIDFSKYDNDGDRYIDFVYMIYAGVGAADTDVSDAIWPQSVYVAPTRIGRYYLDQYACSNEISGAAYKTNKNTSTLAGIGVFVHEFGHVLGLIDFYDTKNNGTGLGNTETPYIWDLMDMGEYNSYPGRLSLPSTAPPRLNAFERYSIGWLVPRVLKKVNDAVTLMGIDKNDAILIPSDNPNEYFLLDYRAKYDSIAPSPQSGMLIWRVSYDSLSWFMNDVNVENVNRFWLFRADGSAAYSSFYTEHTDPGLKGDPFPGSKKVTEFKKFVTYAGDSLGLRIYDITESDSAVHFRVEWDNPDEVSSSSEASSSSIVSSSSEVNSSSSEPFSSSSLEMSSAEVALPEKISVAWSMRVEGAALHVDIPFPGEKEICLFDVQGHLLYAARFAGNVATIGLDALPHGNYVVRIDAGGRVLKNGLVRF